MVFERSQIDDLVDKNTQQIVDKNFSFADHGYYRHA